MTRALVALAMALAWLLDPAYEPCGVTRRCGRRQGHRGHHGGWRP